MFDPIAVVPDLGDVILEQISFETLYSAWPAKVNFAYASCAHSPPDVGL